MRVDTTLITAPFAPISLEAINQAAALQTRADNKYFVPWDAYLEFTTALRATHQVLEIDGRRAFTYNTQYFDTPDLSNYWGHVQERRKRFKCRSRIYENSGLCVFELKLKSGRGETVKHKISYTEAAAGEVNPDAQAFVQRQLQQSYRMHFCRPLVPTLRTHYERVTFASQIATERVTCDFNLEFALGDSIARMDPGYVLVEIKSERGRSDADQFLWHLGVRPASGSKYCVGMALLVPELRSNPFRRVVSHYFVRLPALGERPTLRLAS
ncbi:MAG: polyphosphate polymerase domain-containing protein [Chloroflexi bacterium OHK40]